MKKSLTILIFLLAVAFCNCVQKRSVVADDTVDTVMEISDSLLTFHPVDTIKFGRINSGEVLLHEFTLHNSVQGPIVITEVDNSCGCVYVDYPRKPVASGAREKVSVRFDSRGLRGWQLKYVTVYFGGAVDGQKKLLLTAEVH